MDQEKGNSVEVKSNVTMLAAEVINNTVDMWQYETENISGETYTVEVPSLMLSERKYALEECEMHEDCLFASDDATNEMAEIAQALSLVIEEEVR